MVLKRNIQRRNAAFALKMELYTHSSSIFNTYRMDPVPESMLKNIRAVSSRM